TRDSEPPRWVRGTEHELRDGLRSTLRSHADMAKFLVSLRDGFVAWSLSSAMASVPRGGYRGDGFT
ncbi:hypothetical protein HAX54_053360, partial [Datura stramonium]|nr:hypothetical protein [Datura stramonium]